MPFNPRDKVKNTTRLPAALRDELGLPHLGPARPSGRGAYRGGGHRHQASNRGGHRGSNHSNRPYDGNGSHNDGQRGHTSKPQLKVIGKGPRAQQRGSTNSNSNSNSNSLASPVASSSNKQIDSRPTRDHKKRKQNESVPSKGSKKAKTSHPAASSDDDDDDGSDDQDAAASQPKMRMNPFTGAMEEVKPKPNASKSKSSSTSATAKPTALEKLLAKAESKSSSANGKGKAVLPKRKKRSKMSQVEKDEEDEIAWLEAHIGKASDDTKDDLDDFLEDLDRFQVGMYDPDADADSDDDDQDSEDSRSQSETDSGSGSESESEDESDDSGAGIEDQEASDASDDGDEAESVGGTEASIDEDDIDALAEMDFDSNDEADFSNWDAAMATTDEENDDQEDGESDSEDEDEDEGEGEEDGEEDGREDGSDSDNADAPGDKPEDPTASPASPAVAAPALPAPTAGRYIPPALRAKMAAEAAAAAAPGSAPAPEDSIEQQKLRRQAKGLLNRLGDANIDSIVTEFEALYRSHSRAEVTSMITSLVLDTITARANLIDTYVILHAAFVAALHKVVGVEFAAFFVQKLVEDLLRHYRALREDGKHAGSTAAGAGDDEEEVKGKECLNLTVLVCELYNLQVVACPLIYDLIRLFIGQQASEHKQPAAATTPMLETDVELLLKVVRSAGSQLRHDDPGSLKAIITLTQERVAASSASSASTTTTTKLSSRSRFMLERLGDLKNNRSAKAGSNDPSDPSSPAGQLLTRMKKFLGGMGKKRTVRAYDPLRISLKDLEDADKKGKWWLVGSAWTGQTDQKDAQGLTKLLPMNARASTIQSLSRTGGDDGDVDEETRKAAIEEERQREALLALARKQGMNTDARRSVFVTIMSAEDYQDAAQKLLGLKMNEVQRREIIRVLLHCVGSEKTYNPYYTLILSSLSTTSHSIKITLQYCLWDFLREIGEKNVAGHSMSSRLGDGPSSFDDEDDDDDDEGQSGKGKLSPRRLSNVAQTYAWLLSRSILHLHVLKPVDFTSLRPRGTWFLQLLFGYTVLSCQAANPASTFSLPPSSSSSKNRSAGGYGGEKKLENAVRAGLVGNLDLCRGILWFLKSHLGPSQQRNVVLGDDSSTTKKNKKRTQDVKMDKRVERILESLQRGVDVFAVLVEAAGKGVLGASDDALGAGMGPSHRDGLGGFEGSDDGSDDDDDDDDEGGGMEMTW
ncbi:uncharacterized protein PFL1_04290 [Pseudozyma flocculosa PF-1]|uniref:Related to SGD1 - essential nuclear protein, required for biogenesis of the small ribosomal subunit n=2 Tax=Pseudozyma flocculosa TaxID=84751 RepID=A0A5C3FBK1_9BASI|nr:uncharacterized protein PFL1_04290 [Pseudozyma flocculosa PF-1]EPQ27963.1 hypothetical protein PFL1_04290 [Pseudozyma flocculosa PF-1]SPO41650.1 related to SGD1 - essential nuclear protein, required for biogenesis of the small ribosomal subunit [Pseudozyma flocculosa]